MPGIIIDEFSAKPEGFLAKWRYIRVLINTDTHELGNLCVPGKECINQPNLDDYKKVSRRYQPDDVITTFCDFVTFERITVRAQNEEPFAYIDTEVNVSACGYLTPLPQPAVPPNPWGNVVYGAFKTYDFCDQTKQYNYTLTAYQKNYTGAVTAIEVAGEVPISYRISRENKFDPIVGKEMSFQFTATDDFDPSIFSNDDERQYKWVVERNGELFFTGFSIPDLSEEPFDSTPYIVTLRITDGLSLLRNQTYPVPFNNSLTIEQRFIDVLAFAFAQTGLPLDIYTYNNLYEQTMLNGANDDPMAQAAVNPLRMADDKGNISSCYDVLSDIATTFGAFITQTKGTWNFVRVNDLAAPVVRRRRYNYTALFLYADQYAPIRNVGLGEEIELINANAKKYKTAAYKYVTATLKYGFLPSTVYNGDFEIFDAPNFRYWTTFGGLSFSRIQNSLPGASGAPVLIDNYSFQFNEEFSAFKYSSPATVSVNQGDTIVFTMNIGSVSQIDQILFRMNVGEYWLKNISPLGAGSGEDGNGQYIWIKSGLETPTFLTGLGTKDINLYQIQMDIPECPASGELNIQICGFRQFTYTSALINGILKNTLIPIPYTVVQIDNVQIAITKDPSENTADGTQYRSQQDKYYTLSKSVESVYGDNVNNSIFNNQPNRTATYNPLKNNLHSIFTSDGSYSKLWSEYGGDSTKLPIIAHLARGVLKAYQRTLDTLDCDMQGMDIDELQLFNVCGIPDKNFMMLAGEFDLLTNQVKNSTLVETFDKVVNSQDTSIVSTPALVNSIIPQDTNVFAYPESDRIFYPQFGPEFT